MEKKSLSVQADAHREKGLLRYALGRWCHPFGPAEGGRSSRLVRWILLTILIPLVIIGCKGLTPPIEFYTLTPLSDFSVKNQLIKGYNQIRIRITLIHIPKTINRPNIVTRIGPNRLEMSEFHRWGGSLKEDFVRVLGENLSLLLNTEHVFPAGWGEQGQPDYRVSFYIQELDGVIGESVTLKVKWSVTGKGQKTPFIVKRSVIKESIVEGSYGGFVSAISQSITNLSHEIAHEIKKSYHKRIQYDNNIR